MIEVFEALISCCNPEKRLPRIPTDSFSHFIPLFAPVMLNFIHYNFIYLFNVLVYNIFSGAVCGGLHTYKYPHTDPEVFLKK